MAISPCNSTAAPDLRELAQHGNVSFPIACYRDDLYREIVPWHWHEEFEYAIALPGASTFIVENVSVPLRPGDGIFINSQVLHAVDPPGIDGVGLHSAVFHPRLVGGNQETVFWETLVRPLLTDSALRYIVLKPEIPWQAQILEHFHGAWNAMEQEVDDYHNLIRFHLSAALHLLVKNSPMVSQSLSEQERIDAARVRGMLEYIQAHYTEELTMKEISQSISTSNSVCLRCFHQLLGTTPIQYLKNYRLERAAHLLKNTSKTAREIAFDCGFNDISYFTKSFREKMGCTPKEYQKQNHTSA